MIEAVHRSGSNLRPTTAVTIRTAVLHPPCATGAQGLLGFLFADHMPKETCQERTISRMMSHGRIVDDVSWCREDMRSHRVRHLPDSFGDRLSVRRPASGLDHRTPPLKARCIPLPVREACPLYVGHQRAPAWCVSWRSS